ncbi:argininosuccinate synthase [Sulfobacillus harzensis]|uniref:Argininosuccinate synthase n=1 Tax=Sulfobacillus harzensis TaxID=2729629 RepID=A0A7Y0L1T7_9FIRM|nr:argininosuccinate synthase [Sulfobacillus harzensis]NMP21728.1 argininosuccinate synthase [Sulfobacillus harzensis]
MRIALAYSGGLDTSVIIPWLKEHYAADVFAVVVNVGQKDDFRYIAHKALASGASDVWIPDCRQEFLESYAFPMVQAEALYEGQYLLGTAIARPLIAKKLVEGAAKFGAEAVAHGATGKGNDQVRFEVGVRALNPDLAIIAPWRLWDLKGRQDEMAYAAAHGVPVDSTPESPYSRDENLWHVSHEGGAIENPALPIPPDVYTWTVHPEDAPDAPEVVDIGFVNGIPVSINGHPHNAVTLVESLNSLGSRHGVGRLTMVEDRLVGMKSRGVYETPAGTILYAAHKALTSLVWDREVTYFMDQVGTKLARLTYDGLWFSPLREILLETTKTANQPVTGEVRVKLFKGQATAAAVKQAPESLYSPELATFEASSFSHQDAEGFIRLWGLSSQVYGSVHREGIKV